MNPWFSTQSTLDVEIYAVFPGLMKNKYGRVYTLLISNVSTFKVYSRVQSEQSQGGGLMI